MGQELGVNEERLQVMEGPANRYLSPLSWSSSEGPSASETSSLSDQHDMDAVTGEQSDFKRGIKRSNSSSQDERSTRARTLLTPEQSRVLHQLLQKTWFPSTQVREAVAAQLGLSPRKVQVFFQNKRQKHRKKASAAAASSHTLVVPQFKTSESASPPGDDRLSVSPPKSTDEINEDAAASVSTSAPSPEHACAQTSVLGQSASRIASATRDYHLRAENGRAQRVVGFPHTAAMHWPGAGRGAYADTPGYKTAPRSVPYKPAISYAHSMPYRYTMCSRNYANRSTNLPPIVNSNVRNTPQHLPKIAEMISPSNLR